jgi:acyl-CoA synthetase (NDP forming)
LAAYARVADVPTTVDLAVIVVPAAQVPAAVEDCPAAKTIAA